MISLDYCKIPLSQWIFPDLNYRIQFRVRSIIAIAEISNSNANNNFSLIFFSVCAQFWQASFRAHRPQWTFRVVRWTISARTIIRICSMWVIHSSWAVRHRKSTIHSVPAKISSSSSVWFRLAWAIHSQWVPILGKPISLIDLLFYFFFVFFFFALYLHFHIPIHVHMNII